MAFLISKFIVWPFLKLFIKRIEGLENIPDKPSLIVSSHSSLIDGVVLLFLLAWHKNKRARAVVTKTEFTGLFWNMIFKWAGAIRVNGSVSKAVKVLKEGGHVIIFPEGGRTYTGEVSEAKKTGAGMIALLAKVPVVPVAMNTFSWWNRYQKIPCFKRNIRIIIGKPMKFRAKPTKANAKKAVKEMMKKIKRLKNQIPFD